MRRFLMVVPALALSLLVTGCGTTTVPQAPVATQAVERPAAPAGAQEVVMQAFSLLRNGYTWGGKSRNTGLDCSGLVAYVYKEATGMRIGPDTRALAKQGRAISRAQLHDGDLVFFNTLHRPHSHVGIYVGNGQFVHAFNTRKGIRLDKLSEPYFAARFDGARTFFG